MNNKLTLLYVEDNEIVKENFEIIFSKYFQNIITTDNGRDALKLYAENDIDVAILDISIPEVDGLSVAHEIRQKDKNIEIVMLTGYFEKDKLLKAVNLNLFSYLVKPVKKDVLSDTLLRLIDKLIEKNTIQLAYDYTFNTKLEVLKYKKEEIRLSKNEKKLLTYLCKEMKTYHTACEVSDILFDVNNEKDDVCNNVIQLISRLKKKMLNSYNKEYFFIDNIYGLGYKLQK